MNKQDMYGNLEQAEGNDLIDEAHQLRVELVQALVEGKPFLDGGHKLNCLLEVERELTRREYQ